MNSSCCRLFVLIFCAMSMLLACTYPLWYTLICLHVNEAWHSALEITFSLLGILQSAFSLVVALWFLFED